MNARKQFGDYGLDGLLSIDLVGEDAFANGSGNGCIESVGYFEEGLIFGVWMARGFRGMRTIIKRVRFRIRISG